MESEAVLKGETISEKQEAFTFTSIGTYGDIAVLSFEQLLPF